MEKKVVIQEFLEKMRNSEEKLINYLNNEESNDQDLQYLIDKFNEQINDDKTQFRYILHLLSKVSDYYKLLSFSKIEKILLKFKNEISRHFSNTELFSLFHTNKRILLFLFDQKMLIPNKIIFHILQEKEFERKRYLEYLSIEFEPFLTEDIKQQINYTEITSNIEKFKRKRQEGENDNLICKMIREDSVIEFISYVNKTNLPLSSEISFSFYETHPYLLEKNVSLFEYSAFCGSIQIFKYLQMQGIDMDSSLWSYVIHGQNSELIHILEEIKVEPPNKDFYNCYKEAVKCHSNDFAIYIKENLLSNEIRQNRINFVLTGLDYYNFASFSDEFESSFDIIYNNCNNEFPDDEDLFRLEILNCLAKNDYLIFVQFLLQIPIFKDFNNYENERITFF